MKARSILTHIVCGLGLIGVFISSQARGMPVQWPTNGHYYDLILTNITWQDALADASSNSFLGLPGHLATITSSAESDFILANFATGSESSFAWLGGSA